MIQWGGGCCGEFSDSGSAYTPATNRWRALPASPLAGRRETASAWTGKELVIAGGYAEVVRASVVHEVFFADAAAYKPRTRSWRRLPSLPAPPRRGASAVWDGRDVLVVGGAAHHAPSQGATFDTPLADVFAYRPSTNRWRRLAPLPEGRVGQAAVWTGKQLLVWGGQILRHGKLVPTRTGLSYDPVRNRWTSIGASPIAGPQPKAVWTGTSMIVWGGSQSRAASYTPRR
jgi:N-acetylneuraminic acid mutarotase